MDTHEIAVLSDANIIKEIKLGNIIIDPFKQENLANCSYDVRLGENYYRANPQVKLLNPWVKEHVDEYWGSPLKADSATEQNAKELGLTIGEKFIRLDPGETILGHTEEFIGGKHHITTMMKTRSSLGRCIVDTCYSCGWGDIGYVNRWTMEITNRSLNATIILPVGKRVAQIVFLYTGVPTRSYASKGKYQISDDIEEIKRTWSVDAMLPKLYKDN